MEVQAASDVAALEWPESFFVDHSSIQVGNGSNSDTHAPVASSSISMGNE